MIIKCDPESIQRFIDLIQSNQINTLKIEQTEDGFYYAEYSMALKTIDGIDLSYKVQGINIITEFREMFILDKVNSFYIYYSPADGTCIYNHSYSITSSDINRELQLTTMKDILANFKALSISIGVGDTKITDLYEKSLRQQGIKQVAGSTKGTRFDATTLNVAIEKIIEAVK